MVPLQGYAILEQILFRPAEGFGESTLVRESLDDRMIWDLVKSNLKKLHLQNCTFDPNGLFASILKFLKYRHPSEPYFRFATQFNGRVTQCILSDGFSGQEFAENEQIDSLLFILSDNLPQQSFLDGISSIVFLPLDLRSVKLQSSQPKQILKSMMSHSHPNLKRLLLVDIDLDDNIEYYIPIPQPNLHLICLWRCHFMTSHPIWSALYVSFELIRSIQAERPLDFHFSALINGRTTQILVNNGPSFLYPVRLILFRGRFFPWNKSFLVTYY